MGKKILNLFLITCLAVLFSACKKQHTIILFNQNPITKENLLDNPNQFRADKRFYYIFMSEKPLKTKYVRVQIYKRDDKAYSKMTKLVYSNDFKLSQDQVFYYTDYLVMHETGQYCMLFYSKNDMRKPLAVADFKISN